MLSPHRSLLVFIGLALVAPVCAKAQAVRNINQYIENPRMVSEGQTPPHVPLVPFADAEQARNGNRSASRYFQSLDGRWPFRWVQNPGRAPRHFFEKEFDASEWKRLRVPSSWEAEGAGHPMYSNVPQAFSPYDPPNVPDEHNGTGLYRRTFTAPDSWSGRQVFLHFEGVKSAAFVWLNGERIGYDQGGMTASEYNITSKLQPGSNTLAVMVVRWSDGSYLEDQDMWRFAGIFRSVYLFSTPAVHVRDFYVRPQFDDDFRDALLNVDADVKNYTGTDKNYRLRAQLFDPNGKRVARFEKSLRLATGRADTVSLRHCIEAPQKWSTEKPQLYRLTLALVGPNDHVLETLGESIGFRTYDMRDRQARVNGKPIIFKGVNRHEHDPNLGRTVPVATMKKDMALFKRFNVNAVRLSHYPNDPEWYNLADQYGLYLQDEVNAECHYNEFLGHRDKAPYGKILPNLPAWEKAFMDRFRRMVERDKNHPSVAMWSTGNECGYGRVHRRMADYARKVDGTRLLFHQGNYSHSSTPYADLNGPRYISPEKLAALGQKEGRPVVMGEYSHAMGNSLGHFDEFWNTIYNYPRLQGGFVWDWVNQGLRRPLRLTPDAGPHSIKTALMGHPQTVDGHNGQALRMSGLDDWVEVYEHPALDLTDSPLTLEVWVRPRGWNEKTTDAYLAKGNEYGLARVNERQLAFYVRRADGERVAATAPPPGDWDYNWHHLAGVLTKDSLRLFVDGKQLDASAFGGKQLERSYFPLNVGRNAEAQRENDTGWLAHADIDAVRIYDRALSPRALSDSSAALQSKPILQLDFDRVETHGFFQSYGISPFLINGVIFANRKIQPELWQLKRSLAPVRVEPIDVEEGRVRIINRYTFTNLHELQGRWQMQTATDTLETGTFRLDAPPGDTVTTSLSVSERTAAPHKNSWLTVSFTQPEASAGVPAGHEVAFDQFRLPPASTPKEVAPPEIPDVDLHRSGSKVTVEGTDFTYVFDKTSPALQSMTYQGESLIERGPKLNVWRAPISNELAHWGHAEADDWRAAGLHHLRHRARSLETERLSDSEVRITVTTTADAAKGGAAFENTYTYHVYGSGDLVLRHQVQPNGDMPKWLPKMGLRMKLPASFTTLTWQGRGPFETYPDRKSGARVGVYTSTVDEQYVPYRQPQANSNHTDVRWAALIDTTHHLGLAAFADSTMNTNITAFTNLDRAIYPFQLQRAEGVFWDLDHRVTGVGGTPVTVRPPYRTQPKPYDYRIRLRPYDMRETSPEDLNLDTKYLLYPQHR